MERERDELKSRTELDTSGRELGLMETFEKFIEVQTKMMNAHAKTVAVHNFPPLHLQVRRLTVKIKFHERFEGRASLAGWDNKQKLHQLNFI